MLWLTAAVGQEVHSTDGIALGRVIDLTVRLTAEPVVPDVARVLVQTRKGVGRLIDWDRIAQFEHDRVEFAVTDASSEFPIDGVSAQLAADELLLCRDVLDTQIVDVVGHRLARVADVALARSVDGGLEVLAVEVGFHRVLERLGLRRLADRSSDQVRRLGRSASHLLSGSSGAAGLAGKCGAPTHRR